MTAALETHGVRLTFGRHKGERLTRVPISYLRWMINARLDFGPGTSVSHGSRRTISDLARAELQRRDIPDQLELEISHHAIDRASQHLLEIWQAERDGDEGLHAWLYRRAGAAALMIDNWPADEDGTRRVNHRGIRFCFQIDGVWPMVKTVMRADEAPDS